MVLEVLGQVPSWVEDGGVYLGVLLSVFAVIGGVYGFTLVAVKLMRRAFVYVLNDDTIDGETGKPLGGKAIIREAAKQAAEQVTAPMKETQTQMIESHAKMQSDIGSLSDRFDSRTEILERMDGRLETVEKELHPNGGSSLRDRVDQLAGAVGVPPVTMDPGHPSSHI